jgi:hypothetical protein
MQAAQGHGERPADSPGGSIPSWPLPAAFPLFSFPTTDSPPLVSLCPFSSWPYFTVHFCSMQSLLPSSHSAFHDYGRPCHSVVEDVGSTPGTHTRHLHARGYSASQLFGREHFFFFLKD